MLTGGYERGECLNTVEMFNMQSNTWEMIPPMLSPRGRFDACHLDGKLYACGGSNGQHELKSAECYDEQLKKWKPLPDMYSWRSSGGQTLFWSQSSIILFQLSIFN